MEWKKDSMKALSVIFPGRFMLLPDAKLGCALLEGAGSVLNPSIGVKEKSWPRTTAVYSSIERFQREGNERRFDASYKGLL